MKILLLVSFFLMTTILTAQNIGEKLLDTRCNYEDSTRTVYSDFHKLTLKLPSNWTGEFTGDNPTLKAKFTIDEKPFTLYISTIYDVEGGGLFEYYENNFDLNLFEVVDFSGQKVLIESSSERNSYITFIYCNPGSEDYWVWRLELRGAIGNEDLVNCEYTFVVEQLIENIGN